VWTKAKTCLNGQCAGGGATSNCDDGISCTTDSCNAATGCSSGACTCDTNWSKYSNHCYRLFKEAVSWQSAKQKCVDKGGYLVTITSSAEQTFIRNLYNGSGTDMATSIGLSDIALETDFKWVTGEAYVFKYWRSGNPDDTPPGEDCVSFNQQEDNRWNDDGCSKGFFYICERQ